MACRNNGGKMGGLGGHIKHFYEDPDLTFSKIINFMDQLFNANEIKKISVGLKIDGINIYFSMIDSKLVFARNKSQFQNPLSSLEEVVEYFSDRSENIVEAFTFAYKTLEENLNPEFFHDGEYWIEAEIVYNKWTNVIYYDHDFIAFHYVVDRNLNKVRAKEEDLKKIFKEINDEIRKRIFVNNISLSNLNIDYSDVIEYIKEITNSNINMRMYDYFDMKIRESGLIKPTITYYKFLDRYFQKGFSSAVKTKEMQEFAVLEDLILDIEGSIIVLEKMIIGKIYTFFSEMSRIRDDLLEKTESLIQDLREIEYTPDLKRTITLLKKFISLYAETNRIEPMEGIVINDEETGKTYKITGIFSYLNRIKNII